MTIPDTDDRDEAGRLRADLELISYITSHDLQSPLRIITRTCEELHSHEGFTGDDLSRDLLRTLSGQSAHMRKLLEDLLEYMRLETFEVKHVALESGEMLATAIVTLDEEIKATGAVITSDALPKVLAHRGRLTRLFAHLLDNAIKFRSSATPSIHISAQRLDDKWEFCIKDNGIGIAGEFHTIIFTLFQRLHTADAYPGMGTGLALARKIVESQGGTMRLESAPGQGSRFYFTLPAAS